MIEMMVRITFDKPPHLVANIIFFEFQCQFQIDGRKIFNEKIQNPLGETFQIEI